MDFDAAVDVARLLVDDVAGEAPCPGEALGVDAVLLDAAGEDEGADGVRAGGAEAWAAKGGFNVTFQLWSVERSHSCQEKSIHRTRP